MQSTEYVRGRGRSEVRNTETCADPTVQVSGGRRELRTDLTRGAYDVASGLNLKSTARIEWRTTNSAVVVELAWV